MSTLDEKSLQILTLTMVGVGIIVLLLMLAVLVRLLNRIAGKSTAPTVTGTGTFCGHCGKLMPSDPARVLGLPDVSYFVYRCPTCENETLLPTQSIRV